MLREKTLHWNWKETFLKHKHKLNLIQKQISYTNLLKRRRLSHEKNVFEATGHKSTHLTHIFSLEEITGYYINTQLTLNISNTPCFAFLVSWKSMFPRPFSTPHHKNPLVNWGLNWTSYIGELNLQFPGQFLI